MASEDTQEQILDAAQAVIVREGVRGASLRQVAQQADVSLGLLSYHFDDKESLIMAAFERATSRLLEASIAAGSGSGEPADRVSRFLRGAFTDEFLAGDHLRLRISLWAVALTDARIAKVDAAFFERYSAELESLIRAARPDLSSAEVRGRTVDVIATSNGVWLNWARFGHVSDLERGLRLCHAIAVE